MKILFVQIVLLFALTSCSKSNVYTSSGIDGYVYEQKTNNPVHGVNVKVEWQEYALPRGWHSSVNRVKTLYEKSVKTDKNGYFKVKGWKKELSEKHYFQETSPVIHLEKEGYQPYIAYSKKGIPVDPCRKEANKYYLEDYSVFNESSTYKSEKINGKLISLQDSSPLVDVEIILTWHSYQDICRQPNIGKVIFTEKTKTNNEGNFYFSGLKETVLEKGYKIPKNQPKIEVRYRKKPHVVAVHPFWNSKNYRDNRVFHKTGNVKVNFVNNGKRTENIIAIDTLW